MFRRGSALPTRMSASGPLTTFCPTLSPSGCRIYRFSPSAYASNAIREERLGSYSMVCTVAEIPILSRLKSIMRSFRLCPPPIKRMVMSPELRRPPVRCFGSTSGLCGFFVVMSSLTIVVRYRSVCVVGLYVLIGIISSSRRDVACNDSYRHQQACLHRQRRSKLRLYELLLQILLLQILRVLRHLLAAAQAHVRLLPIRTIPGKSSAPPFFARICGRAHRMHLDFKNRLHRFLDFRFGRLRSHLEHQRVLVLLDRETFFSNHRTANDLVCALHYATSAALSVRCRRRRSRVGCFAASPSLSPDLRCFFETESFSDSCNFSIAGCEKITRSCRNR